MDYAMLALSAVLLAVDFSLNKIYQKSFGTSPKSTLLFNCLLGFVTAAVFFVINGFSIRFTVYSWLMAGAMSLLSMSYSLIGFQLLKSGGMALYTLFLMAGGMLLPYFYGLIFLDESFEILKTAATVLILIGVIVSNLGKARANAKQIAWCAAVFVLNGFVSIVSKVHQTQTTYDCVNAQEFIFLSGVVKGVLAGVLFLIFAKKEAKGVRTRTESSDARLQYADAADFANGGEKPSDDIVAENAATISGAADAAAKKATRKSICKVLLIVLSSAVVGGVSYLLQLKGAQKLPAGVIYPFITGGSIVFSTIAGAVFFREKLSKKLVFGVALCFVGTLMFL